MQEPFTGTTPSWTDRFDALIFDLDDTLLDTTGQLIAPAIRRACASMIEAGLQTDLETCVTAHQQFFRQKPGEDVYQRLALFFGVVPGGDPIQVGRLGAKAYTHYELDRPLSLFDGIKSLLDELKRAFALYLVTSGSPATQRQKIDALAIAPLFRNIHLVDSSKGQRKGAAFREILSQGSYAPQRVLCIGDRPDKEIRDARQLGLGTVRIRYGEYAHLEPRDPEEHADHTIEHICLLAEVLTTSNPDPNP